MTHVVALCNQKGGVGKTTLTINLGAALAHLGQRVLLVDLDPQGHLTEGVGLHELYLAEKQTIFDCMVEAKNGCLPELIVPSKKEPFAVIPSTYKLMLAEQALYMARNREHKLKNLFTELPAGYDWVLIDCPPVLGNLTDNALNASKQVIIPIQAEATSVRALELLFDQIESIEKGLKIQIKVLAVVPNLVQDTTLSKRILHDLRQAIPHITPFEMKKRVMLQAAWEKGTSIFAYKGATAAEEKTRQEIMAQYTHLAEYVIERAANGGQP
jgi:chromosome partitioning protein